MNETQKHIDGGEFVSLITANQRYIYAYILTLVPNVSDADDVFQETTAMMWEKKDDFQAGTDFVAWGIRIAYFKILDFRKKQKKHRMVISDDHFKQIADKALVENKKTELVFKKLNDCIKKLSPKDQHLIHLRYSVGLSVKNISTRIHVSIRMVYSHLSKIQGLLLDCIER